MNVSRFPRRAARVGMCLFYHLMPTSDYMLSAGLFDGGTQFRVTNQIFIDEKPDHYALANNTITMTGEEVFAQFKTDQGAAVSARSNLVGHDASDNDELLN